jgi:hypothetical protein
VELSANNPAARCFEIECEILDERAVTTARGKLLSLLRRIQSDSRFAGAGQQDRSKALAAAHDLITVHGYSFDDNGDGSTLFTNHINSGILNCQSCAIVLAALAHELGWDAFLRDLPGHLVVSLGRDKNIDRGEIRTDDALENEWITVSDRLGEAEFSAICYLNRGHFRTGAQQLQDYNTALQLYPTCVAALSSRAAHYVNKLKDYEAGRRDYQRAVDLGASHPFTQAGLAETIVMVCKAKHAEWSRPEIEASLQDAETLCADAESNPVTLCDGDMKELTKELKRLRDLMKGLRKVIHGHAPK